MIDEMEQIATKELPERLGRSRAYLRTRAEAFREVKREMTEDCVPF